MKKRFYICYFVSFAFCLGFGISYGNNSIPMMVLFAILSSISVVWMCKIMESGERWSYKQIRRISKTLGHLTEKEIPKIWDAIDGKEDKPFDITLSDELHNVRPGSRPSAAYQDMVAERGEKDDNRAEDPTAS